MYAAMLTLCLGLPLGQVVDPVPPDVHFWGQSVFKLKCRTARKNEVRELTLYSSRDEGATWQQAAVIKPNEDSFLFEAPIDGPYWFQAATTDHNGKQDPENLLDFRKRPGRVQKWIIHTIRPYVNIKSAQRQGEEIVVDWEITEIYPDLRTFKLEYQVSPSPKWHTVEATPSLKGQARFRPGNMNPVTVRLYLCNMAKNDHQATVEVSGSGGQLASSLADPGTPPLTAPPGMGGNTLLAPPPGSSLVQKQDNSASNVSQPPVPPQPPAPPQSPHANQPSTQPPGPPAGLERIAQSGSPAAVVNTGGWKPPQDADSHTRLVASNGGAAPITPAPVPRKPLPTLGYINTREVTLEYQLSKIGPSGVGSVDFWWTRNDGKTWERYAFDDPDVQGPGHHKVLLPLVAEDGVAIGITMIVRSKAGLGRPEPRPGDVPDMRVEIDTIAPVLELFAPIPDPQRANSLILSWTARDKNLGPTPIDLEWAEHPNGQWHKIASHLPNDGRYSWQLPEHLPVQVYLRVSARDLAGNLGVATTPTPQMVDLTEPVGTLLRITPGQK